MKKHKLKIILAIAVAALVYLAMVLPEKKHRHDFNIILISIDTLRADHLGCYKYNRNTSPAVDKFRKDSVLFRRCIAQSTSTLASHASILTSLIPSHHGAFFTRSQPLPGQIETMAERLKKKNYLTVSFNDGGQIAPEFGLNQGFDIYQSMNPKNKAYDLVFSVIVDKTAEWLDNRHDNQTFFLFLHTYETHHPYTPAKEYLKLFESGYKGNLPDHISVKLIDQINKGEITLNDEDKKHILNAYDAEIRMMDDSFGRLTDLLKKKKLYDNTMIIFTSDHGEEFGEHGIWALHSHTLFNEQLHVPLIIKLPGSKFASSKVNRLVRSIDILPTVLDLLGEKEAKNLEGISLVPLMKGKKPGKKIFAVSQRDMQQTYDRKYWSVMDRKWKLYDSKLYNLLKDPGESIDASGTNRDLKRKLEKFAVYYIKKNMQGISGKKVKMDDELKKKLKSLGYLD